MESRPVRAPEQTWLLARLRFGNAVQDLSDYKEDEYRVAADEPQPGRPAPIAGFLLLNLNGRISRLVLIGSGERNLVMPQRLLTC